MCGICGAITKKHIDISVFDRMTDALAHRGPNDRGVVSCGSDSGWNVLLGHRRLSIIDLSEGGHQPMSDPEGRYTIVFNGEIYNYRELKENMTDYIPRSGSDTEILLQTYIRYGRNCLDHLNGMFAFAIYDKQLNELFMARDRMGEKPLYYYLAGGDIVFASELKSIMAYPGFNKTVNTEVLIRYFAQNTILPPDTIFEDTYKLCAGEYLVWKDGNVDRTRYYDVTETFLRATQEQIWDYGECKNKLKELLYDSVEKRLIADVPFGVFLSGGIDSTLMSVIARDIQSESGIDTFSIGFEDKDIDESSFAAQTAAYLGTRHHEKIMNDSDLMELLPDLTVYYDEPFSDSSQLPTMLVSGFASQNVTVVLSGDGGDELFAGYSSNDAIRKLQKLDPFVSIVRTLTPSFLVNRSDNDHVRELFGKKRQYEKIQYFARIKEDMIRPVLLDRSGTGTIDDDRTGKVSDWIDRRMLLDLSTYLPDELMTKVDRASMRFSLETRCPLLDHRIIELAMKIPLKYRYNNGNKKYILKDILYESIPEEMMNRPKRGFVAPVRRWLLTRLNGQLESYCDGEMLRKQHIFDADEVRRLVSEFRKKDINSVNQLIWSYFVFQMWYERYIGVDT